MSKVEPIHCRPAAFDLMAAQSIRLARSEALLGGAVAIAQHEMPEVEPARESQRIDEIVADIRGRFRSDSPHAILAHAHHVLFDEMRLQGAIGDEEPLDYYLPAVLDRRRGAPVVLVMLYKLVLDRLGVPVHGLDIPGRFMAGIELDDSVMFVDVAVRGRVVSMRELVQFMLKESGRSSLSGKNPLPIASHREWLQRLLRNLMGVFGTRNRPTDVAAMVELKGLLDE
ncbi:MAG: transglutaminase family protein [Planctomycetes bacterium]|nr:transglutaminase family protein [Planctomycetota bacterium]